jgi:hypothetical protein
LWCVVQLRNQSDKSLEMNAVFALCLFTERNL